MTRLVRPVSVLGAAAALWLGVACLDVSSPVSGIASISFVTSATPSVVRGDSLRDTNGVAQPLHVDAFGANGEKLSNVIVKYYAIDTAHQLHVDSVNGFVWAGDTLTGNMVSPNAAIFARVWPAKGKGFLDTPLDTIPVVAPPDSANADTNFTFVFDAAADSSSSALITLPFGLTLRANADTVVPKYLVGFELGRVPVPRSSAAGPFVVLTSALSTAETTYAVTDGSGRAVLRLRLRTTALPLGLAAPGAVDTAVVRFRIWNFDPKLRTRKLIPILPADSIIITIQSK